MSDKVKVFFYGSHLFSGNRQEQLVRLALESLPYLDIKVEEILIKSDLHDTTYGDGVTINGHLQDEPVFIGIEVKKGSSKEPCNSMSTLFIEIRESIKFAWAVKIVANAGVHFVIPRAKQTFSDAINVL
ncbi:uncharacterized protein ASPGLDRAFT_40759 [Aspergillus glaucus CBS 516.65]|uniref:Uncharacterized protein n=1 Tax=Aspergillus glaucus CBS 516.65 TaxID=1160497 RepID=A0A1L9V3K8_ASPGL|nr:hypothetical protein ASPGLDRAFT_40759 [Aspergillus glaucus CBS 516.65]OJJ78508.1 hypothetical protein ASPGLDRAFT_40759 [Aspergillus glaucus CBS 516.65]